VLSGCQWIAYTSDEAGEPIVYVRPFPIGGGISSVEKWRSHPSRRADGKEWFCRGAAGTMMAVPIGATSRFDSAFFPSS
jgi:hypothetical protein